MTTKHHPTAELVTIHWLKGVADLPSNQIGTTLPAKSADFATNGFVQVQAVAGVPDSDTFMQYSVMQVDTWAYNDKSNRPPWGKANQLAMLVKAGLENPSRRLTLPTSFHDARVHQVIVRTDPRRILADEAYARYSMDLLVAWTPVRES